MVQKSENAAFDAALRNFAEHHGDESLAGMLHAAYQGSPSGFSVKKWTSTPEVIAARFETAQLEVARQPLVQALESSASAGKAIAAEHVLTSDQVIALLGGSGKAHAHEDRASEADLEKLRSSIKARIANAGVTSTEINSIVAELDRLGETELKTISGNIPQLIAAAANEAIHTAHESTPREQLLAQRAALVKEIEKEQQDAIDRINELSAQHRIPKEVSDDAVRAEQQRHIDQQLPDSPERTQKLERDRKTIAAIVTKAADITGDARLRRDADQQNQNMRRVSNIDDSLSILDAPAPAAPAAPVRQAANGISGGQSADPAHLSHLQPPRHVASAAPNTSAAPTLRA